LEGIKFLHVPFFYLVTLSSEEATTGRRDDGHTSDASSQA